MIDVQKRRIRQRRYLDQRERNIAALEVDVAQCLTNMRDIMDSQVRMAKSLRESRTYCDQLEKKIRELEEPK